MLKHEEQRVSVLIDVQNMYHSAKNLYDARVNFKELLQAAVGERKLIRAVGYTIKTETGEEEAFLHALRNMGIETKIKPLQIFPGGMKKGDWDVGMAVDAIKFSNYVDAIILVTGDGDFVPLIEYLKSATPVRVEIVAFEESCSGELKEKANDFINLSQEKEKYLLTQ